MSRHFMLADLGGDVWIDPREVVAVSPTQFETVEVLLRGGGAVYVPGATAEPVLARLREIHQRAVQP